MNEDKFVKYSFKYEDEFGQATTLDKSLTIESIVETSTPFDSMVEVFKQFLIAAGYHPTHVNSIQVIETKVE